MKVLFGLILFTAVLSSQHVTPHSLPPRPNPIPIPAPSVGCYESCTVSYSACIGDYALITYQCCLRGGTNCNGHCYLKYQNLPGGCASDLRKPALLGCPKSPQVLAANRRLR